MNKDSFPPNIGSDDCVILFDGVCKLCNGWSRFIITHDKKRLFKLSNVQSEKGAAILAHFGYPTDVFNTMLYVEGNCYYEKSDAFIRIVSKLEAPWKYLKMLYILPKPIRDWLYDRIALNRYKLFGKYDQCILPTPDHESRFL